MGQSQRNEDLTKVGQTAGNQYNQLMGAQTPLEREMIPQSQSMWNTYNTAKDQNMADYGNIMSGYQDFSKNLGGPTKFSYQNVSAERPAELGKAYGYLDEAMPGYRDFASTGGYSPTDIQELRARGVSPIRSAYGNTMMEMDRSRSLGGAGGSPNYIAAASKAQRELPGQMADATTTVNAQLADAIRQGKLAGLSGMTNVGSTMGGLSSQEAGRMLQASMSNQNADLQSQQLSEQSLQNLRQSQLAGLSGQTNLYGTTPAMSSTFGNQALQSYGQRINLEGMRNQQSLGLLDAQIRAYGGQSVTPPWWQQALGAAGSVLPYLSSNKPTSPTTPTTPGQQGPTGQTGPQGTPGVNVNTPVTPSNWYNNAPPMQPQGPNPTPTTSSNWYIPGQQTQTPNDYFNNQYYPTSGDPFTNSSQWFPYGGGNPWDTSNWGGWADFGPEYSGPSNPNMGNPWDYGTNYGNS